MALFCITCTVSCQSGAFWCSNGQCISSADRCDGNQDCTDGTDESECSSPTTGSSSSKYVFDHVSMWRYYLTHWGLKRSVNLYLCMQLPVLAPIPIGLTCVHPDKRGIQDPCCMIHQYVLDKASSCQVHPFHCNSPEYLDISRLFPSPSLVICMGTLEAQLMNEEACSSTAYNCRWSPSSYSKTTGTFSYSKLSIYILP